MCIYIIISVQKGDFVGRDFTSDDNAFNAVYYVHCVHYVPEYTVTTAMLTQITRWLGGYKFYRAYHKIGIVELPFFLKYNLVFCNIFCYEKISILKKGGWGGIL